MFGFRAFLRLFLAFSVLICLSFEALAQATAIDVTTPLINYVIAFLAATVAALVPWAVNRITGVQMSAANQAVIQTAMQNGLALAVSKFAPNGVTIETKSAVLSQAANYVLAHAPGAAKAFGLDTDPAHLAEKLEARLVQLVPVTPVAAAIPVSPAAPVAAN